MRIAIFLHFAGLTCNEGYTLLEEKWCVHFYSTPMTWQQARVLCVEKDGKLITIDSAPKNEVMTCYAGKTGENIHAFAQRY